MQHSRGPGWAAFGQKQQGKQISETIYTVDSFPATSNTTKSNSGKILITDDHPQAESFSSVVRSSDKFPLIEDQFINANTSAKYHTNQTNPVKLLKDIHMWADQSLIEDILAAVNKDMNQASALLKSMVSSESKSDGSSSSSMSFTHDGEEVSLGENIFEKKLSYAYHEVAMPECLLRVPVEPEWEEDDVYLSHRKEAVKMMRMAAQHSRAASSAFLRGDHISAQQNSSRAHDEWTAAEKLNAKAANEILRIRNINNDLWKIDLHGLHSSEAVNALQDRLQNIESEFIGKHAISSDAAKLNCDISNSALENEIRKKKDLSQHKQMILQVITGTGSHSKGQASLPTAIKSFLIENGYRFDDARPGVFAVRPKYRNK